MSKTPMFPETAENGPDEHDWRRPLEKILGPGASPQPGEVPDSAGQSLALQLENGALRPLRPGRDGKWSVERASWRDLTSKWASVTEGLRPDHLAALRNFHARASRGESTIALSGMSAPAWTALKEAVAAGVKIFCDAAHTQTLQVLGGDLQPRLQIEPNRATEGNLRAQVALQIGDKCYGGPRLILLGQPAWAAWIPALPALVDLTAIAPASAAAVPPPANPGTAANHPGPNHPASTSALSTSGTSTGGPSSPRDFLLHSLLQGRHWQIPAAQVPEFWCQWAESLEESGLVDLSGIARENRPRYGAPSLQGRADFDADNPGKIRITWSEVRPLQSGQGTDFRAPARLERASGDLALLRRRLATLAGLSEGQDLEFFNRRFPVWELGALRQLAEKIAPTAGLYLDFSPELQAVNIYEDGPQLRFNLSAEEDPAGGEEWFDLDFEASVGGYRLPFSQLLGALSRGERWFETAQGDWVDLYAPKLRRLSQILQEGRDLGGSTGRSGLRLRLLHADLIEQLGEVAQAGKISARWRERLAELTQPTTITLPPIKGLKLRPYQVEGARWLASRARAGLGAVLADDMGLGKTLQVLSAIRALRQSQSGPQAPVLVVAPSSVLSIWEKEAAAHAPELRVATLRTTLAKADKQSAWQARHLEEVDLVLTSYTLARLDEDYYSQQKWQGLVLDEAQFVKNPDTAAHRVLAQLQVGWRFALSGTPIENSLLDLWSIFELVLPGLLPPRKAFERAYLAGAGSGEEGPRRISRRVGPFMLRRTKTAVAADLPEKIEQVLEIELDAPHRRAYLQLLATLKGQLAPLLAGSAPSSQTTDGPAPTTSGAAGVHVLAALTRLRQAALSPLLLGPARGAGAAGGERNQAVSLTAGSEGEKLRTLMGYLQNLVGEGHSCLVFSQFTSYLSLVRQALEAEGIAYAYLDGASRDRTRQIEKFKSGTAPVFLISLKAGGFGLNLTEADYVFMCDPWWNPAAESQAIDRAHRIGQTKKVNVYRLVATDTIEARVMALQARKRALVSEVLGGTEDQGAAQMQLSLEDLRELLAD